LSYYTSNIFQAKRITVESVVHSTEDLSSVQLELAVGRTTRTIHVKGGHHHAQARGKAAPTVLFQEIFRILGSRLSTHGLENVVLV